MSQPATSSGISSGLTGRKVETDSSSRHTNFKEEPSIVSESTFDSDTPSNKFCDDDSSV